MNIRHSLPLAVAAALASLALAGCQQDTDDTVDDMAPPVAGEPATGAAPADGTLPGDAAMPGEAPGMDNGMMGDDTMDDGAMDDSAMDDGMGAPTALDVTAIQLGTEAGPDNTIASPQDTFAADDDIVVAIETDGAASEAELSAKLVFEDGQTAGEESETITTTGAETTAITFSNDEPWPTGQYMVEVWINGSQAKTTDLTVE